LLTISEIHLLGDIVRRAAQYPVDSCTYALTTAYRAALAERGIDSNHDKIIYNWVNAISKRCAKVKLEEGEVNFWSELREVCQSQGITIVDEDDTHALGESPKRFDEVNTGKQKPKTDRRRVSFDEARYEETQLSEHSELIKEQTPDGKAHLGRPPTPGRPYYNQRSRSADGDERDWPERKVTKQASPPSLHVSEPDGPADSSMLMHSALHDEERDAQLHDIMDAFHGMSDVRLIRRCIHAWHDAFLTHSNREEMDSARAIEHDGRTLLRQALNGWRTKKQIRVEIRLQEEELRRQEEEDERECERKEDLAASTRDKMLVRKSYEHWYVRHLDLIVRTMRASRLVLAMRYFKKWRDITVENNSKARQLVLRKCIRTLHDRTWRKQLVYEQATAQYEEALQKRLFKNWLWQLRARKAEELHQEQTVRRTLRHWHGRSNRLQEMVQEAQTARSNRPLNAIMQTLRSRLEQRQQAAATAEAHYEHKARLNSMQALVVQGRLRPLEKTMTLRVTLTLQRKAFSVWHLHLSLTRQAAQVDRKRVLQDAWTSWNDTLRTRALARRIDERLLVENLYKWVLQERLSLFRRTADARLARHALLLLDSAVDDYRSTLDGRAAIFAADQRRRKLAASMVHLNLAFRRREDAERKAVEFVNSRALPDVLGQWKAKSEHARKLAKMAVDARWYCLASSTLKTWRARNTEHQHQRRREAYVQIRAQVKYKMVSKFFTTWRTQGMEIQSMKEAAQGRAERRLFAAGTQAFDRWREATRTQREREFQGANVDNQRLLLSALTAMLARHSEKATLEQQAVSFRLESDLALQSSALKKLQWETFTASQQTKTADALMVRNGEKHVKNMLRHWFMKASSLRASRLDQPAEPESPSIRSASRAAARSASKERFTPSHSTSYTPGTPGYMRTPSRSRRAGRFRPIPTPGAVTPFAFDPGYLATTPAPFTAAENGNSNSPMPVGLTPQVTPFARKLRAGGFAEMPPSALRTSVLGRSGAAVGTGKSVRFASAGRFARSTAGRTEVRKEEDGDGDGEGHFKSS
jgi:protein SFI1